MALPAYELDRRIDAVRGLLEINNLDFVFVYFDELNVMNGRYLTGWAPSVEKGAVIVSKYCDPFLIGGPEAAPFAELESAIKTTESCIVFMVPEEEYPLAEILDFKTIAQKYFGGSEIKRVGVVGTHSVPYQIYREFAADLSPAEIVDVTDEYERLRYVKSEWEISQVREANAIADKAYDALAANIIAGKHEYEAAAEAEYVMRKMGSDGTGFRTIIGSGHRSSGIIPAYSDKVFKDGEIVVTGISPRFNGYNSAVGYTFVVGNKPDDIQKEWLDNTKEALFRTKEALKPGLSGREIDEVPRSFLLSCGYGDYCPMPFVHSCGLSEFEKPFFGPSSDDIVAENQVICIDIAMFGNEYIPGIRFETAYLTTKDGCIPFSPHIEKVFGF